MVVPRSIPASSARVSVAPARVSHKATSGSDVAQVTLPPAGGGVACEVAAASWEPVAATRLRTSGGAGS